MYKKKITNKKAFTLAETLVATLILLMVSAIVAAGIPVAKNAYEKVVVKANAEVVMSTAINALRNELSVANDIEVTGDTTITYSSGTYGSRSKIFVDEEGIEYVRYSTSTPGGTAEEKSRLVSKSASDNLTVTYDKAEYDSTTSIIEFTNLRVLKGNKTFVERTPLSISVI